MSTIRLLLYHKDEEMLRGCSCDRIFFVFFLFSLHLVQISHFLWQMKMGNLVHHQVYHFFFFTRLIIHGIHLCLRALALTDQSLTVGKCGRAAECRLKSIIKSCGGVDVQHSPQDGFPSLLTVVEEIGTESSTRTTTFKECICLMLKITCEIDEPRLEESYSVPPSMEKIKPFVDFHLANFVPGLF